jgi:hypothetical protein
MARTISTLRSTEPKLSFPLPELFLKKRPAPPSCSVETLIACPGFETKIWRYERLAATLNLTWSLFAKRSPIFSGKQAAFYASRLLQSQGNIKDFLARLTAEKEGEELQIELERAFRAVRSIEFFVPDVLRATEILVNHFCEIGEMPFVEYTTMAKMVESYFLPSNVKALEEIGIPTPIGVKLVRMIGEQDSSDAALRIVRSLKAEQLERANISAYEQELLRSAL